MTLTRKLHGPALRCGDRHGRRPLRRRRANVPRSLPAGAGARNPAAFTYLGPGMGSVRLLQGRVAEVLGSTSEYIDQYPVFRSTMVAILSLIYAECGMPDEARCSRTRSTGPMQTSSPRYAGVPLRDPPRVADLLPHPRPRALAASSTTSPCRMRGCSRASAPRAWALSTTGWGWRPPPPSGGIDSDRHFAAAHEIHDANGWRAIAAECRCFHALALERGPARDAELFRALAEHVIEVATELGMAGPPRRMRPARPPRWRRCRGGAAHSSAGGGPVPRSSEGEARQARAHHGSGVGQEPQRRGVGQAVLLLDCAAGAVRWDGVGLPRHGLRVEGELLFSCGPSRMMATPPLSDWWTLEVPRWPGHGSPRSQRPADGGAARPHP